MCTLFSVQEYFVQLKFCSATYGYTCYLTNCYVFSLEPTFAKMVPSYFAGLIFPELAQKLR